MNGTERSLVSTMQAHFVQIGKETTRALGKKKADSFVSLWNDSFTICDAIEQTYRPEDLSPSLVWFRLATMTFSAELYWLHFLFLAGNYSLIFPRLRFLWEMVYRAYYADTYQKESPKDPDGPGASLDQKSEWLEVLEEKCALGWGKMVKRVLCQVFPLAKQEREVLDYYPQLLEAPAQICASVSCPARKND
jgi:hypothetical protein